MRLRLRLDSVGDEQGLDRAIYDPLHGAGREDTVGNCGMDLRRAETAQLSGYLDERARRGGEIVHDEGRLTRHVADDLHHLGVLVVAWPLFHRDGERAA